MYIDQLDTIADENNSSYHRTIKMKPLDVKSRTDTDVKNDDEDHKLKICDCVRIRKYKNIFAKCFTLKSKRELKRCFQLKSKEHRIVVIDNRGPQRWRKFWKISRKRIAKDNLKKV